MLSAFALYPTYTGDGDAFVPIGIAALLLALFTLLHPRLRLMMEDVDEVALDALD